MPAPALLLQVSGLVVDNAGWRWHALVEGEEAREEERIRWAREGEDSMLARFCVCLVGWGEVGRVPGGARCAGGRRQGKRKRHDIS